MFVRFNLFLLINLLVLACSGIKPIKREIQSQPDFFSSLKQYAPTTIELRPGEVRIIRIPVQGVTSDSVVECNGSSLKFAQEGDQLVFVLAESYFSSKQSYSCYVGHTYESEKQTAEILKVQVHEKKFPGERLYVDQKKIFLSAEDQARVDREQLALNQMYKETSQEFYPVGPFIRPLNTKVTSIYGTRRIFNNHKQTQHLGVDFRAIVGTEVKAASNGRVVFASDLFYTGNTIIIDHGLGLFSVYGHLKEHFWNTGDFVKQGDVIGLSGRSGRVTGPHLHWGVKANGNWVDGLYLVDDGKADLTYVKFE